MVGREVQLVVDRGESNPGEPTMVVEDLHVADDRGHETVRGVSFELRSGEILGIAGVAGNGQDELVEAITGLRKASSGHVRIDGREITGVSPNAVRDHGMGYFDPPEAHGHGRLWSHVASDVSFDELHAFARRLGIPERGFDRVRLRPFPPSGTRVPSTPGPRRSPAGS